MARFIPIQRDNDYLFPPSMSDWLPEHHLSRSALSDGHIKRLEEQLIPIPDKNDHRVGFVFGS